MMSRPIVHLGGGFNSVKGKPAESAMPIQPVPLDKKKALSGATKKETAPASSSDAFQVTVNMPPSLFRGPAELIPEKPTQGILSRLKKKATLKSPFRASSQLVSPPSRSVDFASYSDDPDIEHDRVEHDVLPHVPVTRAYRVIDKQVRCDVHSTTSLVELERDLNASFGVTAGSGIATASLGIDITKIKKQASQELYYALMLYCIESVEKIDQPYYMETSSAELLRKSGMRFFDDHGDQFVDSIQYGRWALVILQFRAETKEEQKKIAAKISGGAAAAPLEVTGGLSQSIQETFKNESYDIKIFTGGLDHTSAGRLKNIDGLDAIVRQFHVEDQKSAPVQISWTSKPYMAIQHKQPSEKDSALELTVGARINARTMERLASNACHLAEIIKKALAATEMYMQALNQDKVDRQLGRSFFMPGDETDTVERIITTDFDIDNQPDKDKLVYFLMYLRRIHHFLKIQYDNLTRREQCNPQKAHEVAVQTKQLISALSKVYASAPAGILLPLLRVSLEMVSGKEQKHTHGEYAFDLIPPDHSSFLQVLSTGNISEKCNARLKRRDFQGNKKPVIMIKNCEMTESDGPKLPITTGLSGLYWKSDSSVQHPIDMYVFFSPSYPSRDVLPYPVELNPIIATFKPLQTQYDSFCRADVLEAQIEEQSASDFQQQRMDGSLPYVTRGADLPGPMRSTYSGGLLAGQTFLIEQERAILEANAALDRYTQELRMEEEKLMGLEERIKVKHQSSSTPKMKKSLVKEEMTEMDTARPASQYYGISMKEVEDISGFNEENELEKEREQTIKRYNAVRLGREQALATLEALRSPPISRVPVSTNMSRYTKELISEQQNSSPIRQKRTLFFNPVVKGDPSDPLLDREQPTSLNTAEEKGSVAKSLTND